MKKFMLAITAVVLGISFSAFTPAKTAKTDYYWKNGAGLHQIVDEDDLENICPAGTRTQCVMFLNQTGTTEPIFLANGASYERN